MERREKILKHIDRDGRGLEIGPGYCPAAPKKDGFQVETIDYLDQEGLVEKFQRDGVDTDRVEEVDFVWKGEPYAELTGKRKYYDWVIASHVIEHTPDLIGFLNECDSVLKDDGVLSLVIPDKRFCFDHFRPLTSIAEVIDSHLRKPGSHTPGKVLDFYLNTVEKAGIGAWNPEVEGEYELCTSWDEAVGKMNAAMAENGYQDVHAWCFVPHSFRLMLSDLYRLGMIPFREIEFFPTEGCEFFLTIGRAGKGLGVSRLEMMKTVEFELVNQPG